MTIPAGVRRGALAAVVLAAGGGLLWLGATGRDPVGPTALMTPPPPGSAVTAAGGSPSAVPPSVPAATAVAPEAPAPAKPVDEALRHTVITEFAKAAEVDIANAEKALAEARAANAPADQVAALEAKVKLMKQFRDETLARNPG